MQRYYSTVLTMGWAVWALVGAIALGFIGTTNCSARTASTAPRTASANSNFPIAPGTIPGMILFNAQAAATDLRPSTQPTTIIGAVDTLGGGGIAMRVHTDSGTTGYVVAPSADAVQVGSRINATGSERYGVLWAKSVAIQSDGPASSSAPKATVSGIVQVIFRYSGYLTLQPDSGPIGLVLAPFTINVPVNSRVAVDGSVDRGVMFATSVSLVPVRNR